MAPVKAPRSCPKSSLSRRPDGIAAQLSFTNVRSRRWLRSWMARASSSSGDDLDAVAVHLGKQHLSGRIDDTDVRKLDPDRDSRLCLSDPPPRPPELSDPFVLERTLQPQRPGGPAVRGHVQGVGDAQHRLPSFATAVPAHAAAMGQWPPREVL